MHAGDKMTSLLSFQMQIEINDQVLVRSHLFKGVITKQNMKINSFLKFNIIILNKFITLYSSSSINKMFASTL